MASLERKMFPIQPVDRRQFSDSWPSQKVNVDYTLHTTAFDAKRCRGSPKTTSGDPRRIITSLWGKASFIRYWSEETPFCDMTGSKRKTVISAYVKKKKGKVFFFPFCVYLSDRSCNKEFMRRILWSNYVGGTQRTPAPETNKYGNRIGRNGTSASAARSSPVFIFSRAPWSSPRNLRSFYQQVFRGGSIRGAVRPM